MCVEEIHVYMYMYVHERLSWCALKRYMYVHERLSWCALKRYMYMYVHERLSWCVLRVIYIYIYLRQTFERNAILENELDEKQRLAEMCQRLKDEVKGEEIIGCHFH